MPRSALPPFLQKLRLITETVPDKIASWSEDGKTFVIKNSEEFELVLKQHFKGNVQTFVRQLHFYGFRKLDSHNGGWSFAHKNFTKEDPDLLFEIRRKTRSDPNADGAASQVEVQALRTQVAYLQDVVDDLRTQLDSVLTILDEAGVADVSRRYDGLPIKVEPGKKRPRTISTESKDEFVKTCENVEPTMKTRSDSLALLDPLLNEDNELESASLGYLSENDIKEIGQVLAEDEEENDDDLDTEEDQQESKITEKMLVEYILRTTGTAPDNLSTEQAAKVIASATQLDPIAVQKVLQYFRTSVSAVTNASSLPSSGKSLLHPSRSVAPSNKKSSSTKPEFEQLVPMLLTVPHLHNAILSHKKLGQISPLPAQKVGAN